jgi:polyisoprenyl-phosphate glycosyltransferase
MKNKSAKGQNIILLDGDLQDPPEVIPNLIHEKHKGYDVVYGIKTERKEGIVIKGLTAIFYQFMFFLSGIRMPRNVGTFSIFTRQIGDEILQFPESNKFFSSLRHMAGFKQKGVNYKRAERTCGDSKSLIVLARMAMNAIFSNAIFPMRIVMFFTSILAVLTGFTGLYYFYQAIEGSDTISNLSFIFQPFVMMILSLVLLILVVIAEVVSRIDSQVKKRPDFIIKSIIRNGVVENV